MEAVKAIPGLQETVLEDIVGVVMGEDDAAHDPIELLTVLAHEHLKAPTLRVAVGKQLLDLLVVVHLHNGQRGRNMLIPRLMALS